MRSGLALSLLVTLISGAIPARAADLEATPPVQQPADQDQLERLVRLEQALQESRQRLERQQAELAAEIKRQQQLARELAALRHQIAPSSTPTTTATTTPPETTTPAATPTAAVRYSPGRGFTITAGEASLQVSAEARLLGFSNSRYMFNRGNPWW